MRQEVGKTALCAGLTCGGSLRVVSLGRVGARWPEDTTRMSMTSVVRQALSVWRCRCARSDMEKRCGGGLFDTSLCVWRTFGQQKIIFYDSVIRIFLFVYLLWLFFLFLLLICFLMLEKPFKTLNTSETQLFSLCSK